MDAIFLHELKLDVIVGICAWEHNVPQTIQLDLDIALPHCRACHTDEVEDTIDYGRVAERVRQLLNEKRFALVEALAEHVAQLLLQEFGSPWVRVGVTKLGALRNAKRVGVVIERGVKPA